MHPLRFPNSGIRAKWHPQGVATARGHNRLQRGADKGGRLPVARKGLSPATIPATSRRGGHPLAVRLPTGKGSHRLHRGSDDDV
ncbi:hypothetical protein BHM03_00031669 [Ensete ventricosum]|nr:hypothetical protein BHM03_00031669 [Ensete ventricosum]